MLPPPCWSCSLRAPEIPCVNPSFHKHHKLNHHFRFAFILYFQMLRDAQLCASVVPAQRAVGPRFRDRLNWGALYWSLFCAKAPVFGSSCVSFHAIACFSRTFLIVILRTCCESVRASSVQGRIVGESMNFPPGYYRPSCTHGDGYGLHYGSVAFSTRVLLNNELSSLVSLLLVHRQINKKNTNILGK